MPNVTVFGTSPSSLDLGSQRWAKYSLDVNSVTARQALNGNNPIIFERLGGYVSGNGGLVILRIDWGTLSTGDFARSAASSAQDTGYINITNRFFSTSPRGGVFQYADISGRAWVGRNSSSSGQILNQNNSFIANGSLPFKYTYVECPTAPRSLTGTSPAVGRVDISWTTPSSNGGTSVNGYTIQYSTTNDFSGNVFTLQNNTSTSRSITGLTPGTVYYFRTAAKNAVTDQAGTTSVWSNTFSITVSGIPPTEPINLALSVPTPGSITSTWQAPTDPGDSDVDGYQIQYSTAINFSTNILTFTLGNVLTHTATNLNFGSTYYARVRAKNDGGYGPYSATATIFVDGIAPEPPPSLNAISFSPGEVNLSWGLPASNNGAAITNYEIDYSLSPTFASGISTVLVGATTATTISGLVQGSTYYFRVRAINLYGASANSPTANATVFIDPNPRALLIDNIGVKEPAFFSLQGHFAGFNGRGEVAQPVETFRDYVLRVNSPISESFEILSTNLEGRKIYAQNVTGETLYFFDQSPTLSSLNTIRFKAFPNEQDLNITWTGNSRVPSRYSGQIVNIDVNYSAKTMTLSVNYPVPDSLDPFNSVRQTLTESISLENVCLTEEVEFTIQYQRINVDGIDFDHDIMVTASCQVNLESAATIRRDYRTNLLDAATRPWEVSGNIRALVTSNARGEISINNVYRYENKADYAIADGIKTFGPVPSVRKNVWEYLKEAAAACDFEISNISGEFSVRPIGERILDITNLVGAPSISPTSTFTGRQVDIEYTNASILPEGLFYYSRDDDNRILQINPGEVITTTVQSKGSPNFIQQPQNVPVALFLNYVSNNFFPQSAYGVIDTAGLPIVPAAWSARGGNVEVKISTEIAGALDVTITAPGSEIPGTTAPYSLAYSDGVNSFGALALVGSGVVADPKTLELFTGANFDKTQQQVSSTISNPFINTLLQAYDRGIWASTAAAGPIVELSGSIPTGIVNGFGLAAGSIVYYKDSLYRIQEVQIGRVSSSFRATSYVTTEDFDSLQDGATVGDHDIFWFGSEIEDQIIFPLKGLDYN
jgi:hypothetical protein